MSVITLKKDGEFYRSEYGDSKKSTKVRATLIPYLNDGFEIEDGVTFEQFMKHLFNYHREYDAVFQSHLGHFSLALWADEFNKPIPEAKNDDMKWVEVSHAAIEINSGSEYDEFKTNDVSIYNSFDGWGMYDKEGNMGAFGVEYTPLNELKKYPFKLNKEQVFANAKGFKTICTMTAEFTVYDVIGAVLYEISWAGSPEGRDDQLKEITDRIDEIKKDVKDGKSVFKTPEEFFADMDAKIKEFKDKENNDASLHES